MRKGFNEARSLVLRNEKGLRSSKKRNLIFENILRSSFCTSKLLIINKVLFSWFIFIILRLLLCIFWNFQILNNYAFGVEKGSSWCTCPTDHLQWRSIGEWTWTSAGFLNVIEGGILPLPLNQTLLSSWLLLLLLLLQRLPNDLSEVPVEIYWQVIPATAFITDDLFTLREDKVVWSVASVR